MKKLFVIMLVGLMAPCFAHAQGTYMFDTFQNGTVTYKEGGMTPMRFNYDLVAGKFLFLGDKGEQLSLDNPEIVSEIVINGRRFIHIKGNDFYEQVPAGNDLAYYILWKSTMLTKGKPSGYGGVSSTSANTVVSSIQQDQARSLQLESGEEFTTKPGNTYYLKSGKNYKRFYSAESFVKNFPNDQRDAILQFIKDKSIKFTSQQDIGALMRYCATLE